MFTATLPNVNTWSPPDPIQSSQQGRGHSIRFLLRRCNTCTSVALRKNQACPGAIQAVVYMQTMSGVSTLSFTTTWDKMSMPGEQLILSNQDPYMSSTEGVTLEIHANQFFVSLDAGARAGYNPVIELDLISRPRPFSWGFTMMVAACTIICSCLAWAAWMLKAQLEHRRGLATREHDFHLSTVSISEPSPNITGLMLKQ